MEAVNETSKSRRRFVSEDIEVAKRICGNVRIRFITPEDYYSISTFQLGRCAVTRLKASPLCLLSSGGGRSYDPDSIKIGFVSGAVRFCQGDLIQMLAPSSCVIYDPVQSYAFRHMQLTDQITVQVPRSMFLSRHRQAMRTPQVFHRNVNGLPVILHSLLNTTSTELSVLDTASRSGLGDTIVKLASDLLETRLDTVQGEPVGLDVLLARIKAYIAVNLDRLSLSVTEIAQSMGCSPRYVYRAFETQDITPGEYIRDRRLEQARRRLLAANDSASLAELAFMSGFSTYPHFSRAFKARYGAAPREWRAAARS